MPRKPGVSKVLATAPRSMRGTATSRRPEGDRTGNRASPSAASWSVVGGSSSRRLSQRTMTIVERFFDHIKHRHVSLAVSTEANLFAKAAMTWYFVHRAGRGTGAGVSPAEKRAKYKARTI